MQENELELEIVCCDCGHRFKRFSDLWVFHIPKQLIRNLKLKQKPHLKCPYCRGNRFLISVLKDAYGTYPSDETTKSGGKPLRIQTKFRPSSHSEDYVVIATYKTKATAKKVLSGIRRLFEDMASNPNDYNTDWHPGNAEASLEDQQVTFRVYTGGNAEDVEVVMKKFKPTNLKEYECFQKIQITVKLPLKLTMKSAELVLNEQELKVIKWLKREAGKPEIEFNGKQQRLSWEYRGSGIFFDNTIVIPDYELDLDEHPNWKVASL